MNYEDIQPGVGWFRTKEISKTRNPNGSWHREYAGETWYKTKAGEFREDEWERIAEETVKEHGDIPLLEAIEDHVREHCPWIKEKEIHRYSLSCLVDESYRAWTDRGEFDFFEKQEKDKEVIPMAYYNICPGCGAALDPGETCSDCKEKAEKAATQTQTKETTGNRNYIGLMQRSHRTTAPWKIALGMGYGRR